MKELTLSKLESAKRQIEVSISLYFNWGDEVSIHTLISASLQVLLDVNKNNGGEPSFKEKIMEEFLNPEKIKIFKTAIKKPENFFKHADRDHNDIITFNPEASEHVMFECVILYHKMTGELPKVFHFFKVWYMNQHSDIFQYMPKEIKESFSSLNYTAEERTEFYNECMLAMENNIAS